MDDVQLTQSSKRWYALKCRKTNRWLDYSGDGFCDHWKYAWKGSLDQLENLCSINKKAASCRHMDITLLIRGTPAAYRK